MLYSEEHLEKSMEKIEVIDFHEVILVVKKYKEKEINFFTILSKKK